AVQESRSLGGGLFMQRSGRRAFVYVVRGGRVRAVGVTTTRFAAKRAALRSALRRVLRASADNRPRKFIPAAAQAKGAMLGRSIAGTGNPQTDAALALYCGLNL